MLQQTLSSLQDQNLKLKQLIAEATPQAKKAEEWENQVHQTLVNLNEINREISEKSDVKSRMLIKRMQKQLSSTLSDSLGVSLSQDE
jgi:uncharacterized Rmd1/YagE family protein